MSKSPNSDIIDKIYFRNIYSCQRKIYWYKVKVMETINAVWEHSYGEDCIPNFSANMEQPRHRWYEFKEGFSLTLVERAIRETKKDNKSTSFTVLDPFSGSGTSPLTALQSRCNAIGYEVNPFMSFVGKTKCQQRTKSIHDYTKELNRILVQRPFRLKSPLEGVSTFTGSGENGKWLFNLDVLRAYEALYQHISLSEYKDFFLLALITSAMQCCNAKKDGKCLRYLKNWKALNYTGANLRDTFKANALQKLQETRAFVGFSRAEPSKMPISERKKMLRLGSENWLPAIQVHGEGIFFEFNKEAVEEWAHRPAVLARLRNLQDSYRNSKFGANVTGDLRPEFVLIHTFAHLIINQLSFECGYGSSSIRERIYCEKAENEYGMYGVLIYTASGDSEGSLGGLVRQGAKDHIEDTIRDAVRNAAWCSSDPVCIQSYGQGPESCNLAACHNCALLPETCCECGNRLLDRGTVVGTLDNKSIGFFAELLEQ